MLGTVSAIKYRFDYYDVVVDDDDDDDDDDAGTGRVKCTGPSRRVISQHRTRRCILRQALRSRHHIRLRHCGDTHARTPQRVRTPSTIINVVRGDLVGDDDVVVAVAVDVDSFFIDRRRFVGCIVVDDDATDAVLPVAFAFAGDVDVTVTVTDAFAFTCSRVELHRVFD